MKITVKQLKQLIREQVEEMSAGMPEERRRTRHPVSAGLPIHVYAHKKEDGTITFHIESDYVRINRNIPGGGNFDTYSEMDEKDILKWINNQLAQMKNQLS